MPYRNVPEDLWGKMDSCVEKVQARDSSLDKSSAVAICYTSIVEGRSLEKAMSNYNANKQAKQKAAEKRRLRDLERKARVGEVAMQAIADAQAEVGALTAPDPSPDWLSGEPVAEDKGLGDQPAPVRPQTFITRLAPGSSDTLAVQTPYTPRDWIQPERRIDEKQPEEGYGSPMSMQAGDSEPLLPYGGATTLKDVMDMMDAQSKAMQMEQLVDTYKTILGNIMASDDIADKGTAISDAAKELQKMLSSLKALQESKETQEAGAKAQWDTAFINGLPDSAFLFVESGGDKDSEGKTTPRSKRHFPYKDSSGKVDLPHLRNAIARIPQSNAPGLNKDAVQKRAQVILEAENKKELDLDQTAPQLKENLWQKFLSFLGLGEEAKAGARHNAGDQAMIQTIHDHAAKLGADCGMKMLKQLDGSYRWFGWVSNNFRDRDTTKHPNGEIISEAAHKEFIAYLDANPTKAPEWWTWHIPARKGYRADWWDYSDGFLTMSGPADEKEAKGYLDLGDEIISMSHGFYTLARDRENGIIQQYRAFEVSDLPPEAAANPWTSFDIIRKELTGMFTPEKRDYLVKHLGEERVKALEGDTAAMSKALEALGVESKEKGGAPAEVPPDALEAVKTLLNVDGLNKVITELQAQNKALAEQLTELKKSDDAKIAERIKPKVQPVQWGYQASKAKDNGAEGTNDDKAKELLAKANKADSWVHEAFSDLIH